MLAAQHSPGGVQLHSSTPVLPRDFVVFFICGKCRGSPVFRWCNANAGPRQTVLWIGRTYQACW